jgi:hypothetical protein
MSSYAIAFIVVLAACFGVQTLALRMSGGSTVKSESNYFSSIARIQTETRNSPCIMLLGSSMTGRLGDRAAEVPGVANLGCDGGSAVVALRAMDRGLLPVAPVLIIEANTLSYELEGRGKEIASAIDSDWFKLGTRFPTLGATARPAAFGYSWLMARKDGARAAVTDGLPVSTKPAVLDPSQAPKLDATASKLVDELAAMLKRLEAKGSRVFLVMIPPGAKSGMLPEVPRALACKSGVPWWDLNDGLPPDAVGFTDGLHLDAPSAAKVLATLLRGIDAH